MWREGICIDRLIIYILILMFWDNITDIAIYLMVIFHYYVYYVYLLFSSLFSKASGELLIQSVTFS